MLDPLFSFLYSPLEPFLGLFAIVAHDLQLSAMLVMDRGCFPPPLPLLPPRNPHVYVKGLMRTFFSERRGFERYSSPFHQVHYPPSHYILLPKLFLRSDIRDF